MRLTCVPLLGVLAAGTAAAQPADTGFGTRPYFRAVARVAARTRHKLAVFDRPRQLAPMRAPNDHRWPHDVGHRRVTGGSFLTRRMAQKEVIRRSLALGRREGESSARKREVLNHRLLADLLRSGPREF